MILVRKSETIGLKILGLAAGAGLGLSACQTLNAPEEETPDRIMVTMLVGSTFQPICRAAVELFNEQNQRLSNGIPVKGSCIGSGSGTITSYLIDQIEAARGSRAYLKDESLPVLLSVDGDLAHDALLYDLEKLYKDNHYVSDVGSSPSIASTPVVLMASAAIASKLKLHPNPFEALLKAKTLSDLAPGLPDSPLFLMHTSPAYSNSGLSALIAAYAAASNVRPSELTLEQLKSSEAEVTRYEQRVQRYGTSTDKLANTVVGLGSELAPIAIAYESSVIQVNRALAAKQPPAEQPGSKPGLSPSQPRAPEPSYVAVYPPFTFVSQIRAITLNTPWVTELEQVAGRKLIAFMRSPEVQALVLEAGLRPAYSETAFKDVYGPANGVDAALEPRGWFRPRSELTMWMYYAWEDRVKRPTQLVLVMDTSKSMTEGKILALKETVLTLIGSLSTRDSVVLIAFNSTVGAPTVFKGGGSSAEDASRFMDGLDLGEGTHLYDAAQAGYKWLLDNYNEEAIHGLVLLTDGADAGSSTSLETLLNTVDAQSFGKQRWIPLFAIGYGPDVEYDPELMKQLGRRSGGDFVEVNPDKLSEQMLQLRAGF